MAFFKSIALGLTAYPKALRFLQEHRLMHFFLYSLVLSVLLWVGVFWLAGSLRDLLWGLFQDTAFYQEQVPGGVDRFLQIAFHIAFFLWLMAYSKYASLIVLGPVLSQLAERTGDMLEGKPQNRPGVPLFFRELFRSIAVNIRYMFLEVVLLGLVLILSLLLPIASPMIALVGFLVEAYFFGAAMLDHAYERGGVGVRRSLREITRRWPLVISIGTVFSLLFMVPLLGTIAAPVIGVVAGVLALHRLDGALPAADH